MTTEREKRVIEIKSQIALRLGLNPTFNDIAILRRHAITLRKYFEYECNGCTREKLPHESWKEYDNDRERQMIWVEERQKAILSLIDSKCKELNTHYYIQGDPRGASLHLGPKTMTDSNYSTEGVAIY